MRRRRRRYTSCFYLNGVGVRGRSGDACARPARPFGRVTGNAGSPRVGGRPDGCGDGAPRRRSERASREQWWPRACGDSSARGAASANREDRCQNGGATGSGRRAPRRTEIQGLCASHNLLNSYFTTFFLYTPIPFLFTYPPPFFSPIPHIFISSPSLIPLFSPPSSSFSPSFPPPHSPPPSPPSAPIPLSPIPLLPVSHSLLSFLSPHYNPLLYLPLSLALPSPLFLPCVVFSLPSSTPNCSTPCSLPTPIFSARPLFAPHARVLSCLFLLPLSNLPPNPETTTRSLPCLHWIPLPLLLPSLSFSAFPPSSPPVPPLYHPLLFSPAASSAPPSFFSSNYLSLLPTTRPPRRSSCDVVAAPHLVHTLFSAAHPAAHRSSDHHHLFSTFFARSSSSRPSPPCISSPFSRCPSFPRLHRCLLGSRLVFLHGGLRAPVCAAPPYVFSALWALFSPPPCPPFSPLFFWSPFFRPPGRIAAGDAQHVCPPLSPPSLPTARAPLSRVSSPALPARPPPPPPPPPSLRSSPSSLPPPSLPTPPASLPPSLAPLPPSGPPLFFFVLVRPFPPPPVVRSFRPPPPPRLRFLRVFSLCPLSVSPLPASLARGAPASPSLRCVSSPLSPRRPASPPPSPHSFSPPAPAPLCSLGALSGFFAVFAFEALFFSHLPFPPPPPPFPAPAAFPLSPPTPPSFRLPPLPRSSTFLSRRSLRFFSSFLLVLHRRPPDPPSASCFLPRSLAPSVRHPPPRLLPPLSLVPFPLRPLPPPTPTRPPSPFRCHPFPLSLSVCSLRRPSRFPRPLPCPRLPPVSSSVAFLSLSPSPPPSSFSCVSALCPFPSPLAPPSALLFPFPCPCLLPPPLPAFPPPPSFSPLFSFSFSPPPPPILPSLRFLLLLLSPFPPRRGPGAGPPRRRGAPPPPRRWCCGAEPCRRDHLHGAIWTGPIDRASSMSSHVIARAERTQIFKIGLATLCPRDAMVDLGVQRESGAAVSCARAVLKGQPIALCLCRTTASTVHIDHHAVNRIDDHPTKDAGVEEKLLRSQRIDRPVAHDLGRLLGKGCSVATIEQLDRDRDEDLGLHGMLGADAAKPLGEQVGADLGDRPRLAGVVLLHLLRRRTEPAVHGESLRRRDEGVDPAHAVVHVVDEDAAIGQRPSMTDLDGFRVESLGQSPQPSEEVRR